MLMEMESVWEISWLDLTIRMVLSALLGGLIGIEREWSNHAAGFRTHILVCLGSTTIMLMSSYGFGQFIDEVNVRVDPARLAAQVISGIGFLGAGAILRNGDVIKGLTTAASIWTVAAIGLCVGAGFYTGALVCTLMVLISLYVLNKWEKVLLRNRRYQTIELKVMDSPGLWGRIAMVFEENNIRISNLMIKQERIEFRRSDETTDPDGDCTTLQFKLKGFKASDFLKAMEEIMKLEGVLEIDSESVLFVDKQAAKLRGKGKKIPVSS
ncbi:MgtC/SapB family protein [Paenibacillus sp. PAMC21692]|uniref:MgtC/SapB family protein n=1 Tax=Paenibacillus sp. PAMC21692 TaxID=2762320 RepID=UPI0021C34728|nr:MgtC/SapB family protein [Paenibacillus sp. PAMC21692]